MLQPNLTNLTPNALLIVAIKNTTLDMFTVFYVVNFTDGLCLQTGRFTCGV